jgi:hypothetical protein
MKRPVQGDNVGDQMARSSMKRELTTELLRAVRLAVAGGLEPDNALAAVVAVAAIMVGEVRNLAVRQMYEEHVLRMFPRAVSHASHRIYHGGSVQ